MILVEGGLFKKALYECELPDVFECILEPGKVPLQGKVRMKQEQQYRALGVQPLLAHPLLE